MIAIAVDDEVLMLGALVMAIEASPDITEVAKFSGCEEALEFVKENSVDVAFLDIEMSYSDHGKLLPILDSSGFRVVDTEFSDKVTVKGSIKSTEKDSLLEKLTEASGGRASYKNIEEKFDF